jgi:predicted amidophosphoribosyltransferase
MPGAARRTLASEIQCRRLFNQMQDLQRAAMQRLELDNKQAREERVNNDEDNQTWPASHERRQAGLSSRREGLLVARHSRIRNGSSKHLEGELDGHILNNF